MNISYLKFINFSLGTGGMVGKNLQWNGSNNTFRHSADLRPHPPIPLAPPSCERVDGRLIENAPWEWEANVRPDSVAMFSSFPERNASQRPASLYLITRTLMFIQRRQKQLHLYIGASPHTAAPYFSHLESLHANWRTWTPHFVITENTVKTRGQVSARCSR